MRFNTANHKFFLVVVLIYLFLAPLSLAYAQGGYDGEGTGVNPDSVFNTSESSKQLNSIKTDYNLLTSDLPGFESGVVKVNDFSGYLQKIFNLTIGVAAALAVVMFIVGGFQYMTGDSVGMKSDGSNRMQNAIYGLIFVMVAYLALYTINPQLLKLDFKVKGVQGLPNTSQTTAEIKAEIIPPPAGTIVPGVGGGTTETSKGIQQRVVYKELPGQFGTCPNNVQGYNATGVGSASQCGPSFNSDKSRCCEYRLSE